ncbi:Predicted membrane protein [Ceraceosorus bombacis]|uniref:Predicted membrane protein n=1 Tax=Ceraceosorus bombacis TaxID=401625 RepID=A0A0N7L924_9BASI|nr:Predicted membrane protein [Ceraceosorus bombacis]
MLKGWSWSPTVVTQLKRIAPSTLASLLCSVLILVRPIQQRFIGPYAFLSLTFLFLFFWPCTPIGEHLEGVLLSITACAISLGISVLALWGSAKLSKLPTGEAGEMYSTVSSRAVGAITLFVLCFSAGLLSSFIPRLKTPVRIALFVAAWSLSVTKADDASSTLTPGKAFTDLFFPALTGAACSTVAALCVFPRTATGEWAKSLASGLDEVTKIVECTVRDFYSVLDLAEDGDEKADPLQPRPSGQLSAYRHSFLGRVTQLDGTYLFASHELQIARVPLSTMRPILSNLKHLRGWAACGMGLGTRLDSSAQATAPHTNKAFVTRGRAGDQSGDDTQSDRLRPHIEALAREVISSLTLVRNIVQVVSHQSSWAESIASLRKETGAERRTNRSHSRSASRTQEPRSALFAAALGGAGVGMGMDYRSSAFSKEALNAPDRAVLAQRKRIKTVLAAIQEKVADPGVDLSETQTDDEAEGIPSQGDTGAAPRRNHGLTDNNELEMCPSEESRSNSAFLLMSLLEVARECSTALKESQRMLRAWHKQPRRRVWLPSLTWRLFWAKAGQIGMLHILDTAGGALHRDDRAEDDNDRAHAQRDSDDGKSPRADEERRLAPAQQTSYGAPEEIFASAMVSSTQFKSPTRSKKSAITRFLNTRRVLAVRLAVHKALQAVTHSPQVRFALKLATGTVLLSLPAWVARDWWQAQRGQWLVITYIWCLETSTGATLRVSAFRIAGTFAGAFYGIISWYASGGKAPALGFFLVLGSIPAAYLALFTRAPGVGVVMAITFPVVCLIPIIDTSQSHHVPSIALIRGYQILLGIVAALLVNLLVWPYHARVHLQRHISKTASSLQHLYLSLSRQTVSGLVPTRESRHRFEALESAITDSLSRCRMDLDLMAAEIRLVPLPTRVLRRCVSALQNISDLLLALRHVRETAMLRFGVYEHTVLNVLALRTDLISNIVLNLWTAAAAIKTRDPLPQCLPSPRLALQDLTRALREDLTRAPPSRQRSSKQSREPPSFNVRSPSTDEDGGGAQPEGALLSTAVRRLRQQQHDIGGGLPTSPSSRNASRKSQAHVVSLSLSHTNTHHHFAPIGSGSASGSHTPIASLAPSAFRLPDQSNSSILRFEDSTTSSDAPWQESERASDAHSRPAESTKEARDEESSATSKSHVKSADKPPASSGAYLFTLAEHSLLQDIVEQLETVLECVRDLVGEQPLFVTQYMPRSMVPQNVGYDPHLSYDPSRTQSGMDQELRRRHQYSASASMNPSLTHHHGLTLLNELAAHEHRRLRRTATKTATQPERIGEEERKDAPPLEEQQGSQDKAESSVSATAPNLRNMFSNSTQ